MNEPMMTGVVYGFFSYIKAYFKMTLCTCSCEGCDCEAANKSGRSSKRSLSSQSGKGTP